MEQAEPSQWLRLRASKRRTGVRIQADTSDFFSEKIKLCVYIVCEWLGCHVRRRSSRGRGEFLRL